MIGSKERYALVTGASSGIGYEIARLLGEEGKNQVVVARSQDKLEALKAEIESKHGTIVRVLPKDLSHPEAPPEIFSQLEKEGIEVDLLVNNAGFGVYGKFYETDLRQELALIQVNLVALVHLTKLFLKGMVENRSGRILNVASLCSFMPGPLESVYCGSKAGVMNFSEALANELKGTGVSVTCLCPGLAKTQFHPRAHMMDTKVGRRKMMDAGAVARDGLEALRKGKVTTVPGLQYKMGPVLARVIPRSMMASIVRSQHERA